MAITAKFIADFEAFIVSTRNAEQSLKNLQGQGAKLGSDFDTIKDGAMKLAGAFGIAFSVGAVVNFGKELVAAADELTKLHDKTGIGVVALQRFQIAGDDAGNSIDDITSAIVKMEDKLVSGDKSAVAALIKLGLSLDDLRRLSPDQQFIAISDAIRQVQDPAERVAIAIDVFGKQGANVLPTLVRGFDDLKDAAVGMSAETVKSLDDAGDAWDKYWRKTKGVAGTGLALFLNAIFDPLGAQQWTRAINGAADAAERAAPKMAGLAVPGLPEDLKDIEAGFDADARAIKDLEGILSTMDTVTFNLAMDHQKQWRDEIHKTMDERNKTVTDGLGQIQAAEKATADFIAKTALDSLNYQILKIWQGVDEQEAAFKGSEQQRAAFNAAVESLATEQAQALRDAADVGAAAIEDAARRESAAMVGVANSYWAAVDAAAALAGIPSIGHRAPSLEDPGFASPTITGGGLHPLSGTHPLRAAGGPGVAGTSYLVGEKGPELYTPGASGFFTPGGGGSTNITIYVNGTAEDVARQIADKIKRSLMQSAKLVPS